MNDTLIQHAHSAGHSEKSYYPPVVQILSTSRVSNTQPLQYGGSTSTHHLPGRGWAPNPGLPPPRNVVNVSTDHGWPDLTLWTERVHRKVVAFKSSAKNQHPPLLGYRGAFFGNPSS